MQNVPKNITCDSVIVDIDFHPSKDVIAIGDLDGDVTVYVSLRATLINRNHSPLMIAELNDTVHIHLCIY